MVSRRATRACTLHRRQHVVIMVLRRATIGCRFTVRRFELRDNLGRAAHLDGAPARAGNSRLDPQYCSSTLPACCTRGICIGSQAYLGIASGIAQALQEREILLCYRQLCREMRCVLTLFVAHWCGALRSPLRRVSRGPLRATAEARVGDVGEAASGGSRPGLDEDEVFACDESVAFWREFQAEGPASAAENFRRAATIASSRATSGGARAVAYWASHAARTAYFASNALLGSAAFSASRRLGADEGTGAATAAAGFGSGLGGLGVDLGVASWAGKGCFNVPSN